MGDHECDGRPDAKVDSMVDQGQWSRSSVTVRNTIVELKSSTSTVTWLSGLYESTVEVFGPGRHVNVR